MTKKDLGEFIKEQRLAKKLTQKEFAEELGIRRQGLVEIENAQTNYSIDTLFIILEALGYSLSPKSLLLPKYRMKGVKSDPTMKNQK